ncbi:mechanosensitive ion channel domain-containing protein [Thermomonas sp. HDW16]|uniref:mechanosensitive ion channel family protein n=1 Tax=Thermomonas sp. HDW16 TaxID=2714945 RepID=UPI00140C765D|nr:mechanosensitive ion channel domain-containing protein [Thermomonas sp. HDW16]QIL19732.1 mechanosensitive ion channel [Thermomonas sp. HDW16]
MQPGTGEQLREAGDRVRKAADAAADTGLRDLQPLLDTKLISVSGMTITVGGLLLAAIVAFAVWLVAWLLRRALQRYAKRNPDVNQAAVYTVSRVANYLLVLVGVLLAFDVAGIPIGKFTVFAGALGVGLGFGLQAIFNNFVSGLILLFDRSLKIGDFIELDGDIRGTVRAINIRSTRITTNDNIDVLVPNSEFMTKRVVNWTYSSTERRIRVPFGVAYGTDKELVKKAALEAAAKVPFTLAIEGDRQPQVWLVGFGDSAVDYQLVVWLNESASRRNAAVIAAYLWELDTALKTHDIEIPFPQQDLRVRSLFGLEGAAALAALRMDAELAGGASAPKTAMLDSDERARLARNDARIDTEREMQQDAARAAADRKNAPNTPDGQTG